MIVTVRLLGPFARYTAAAEVRLQLPQEATVADAVRALGDQLGTRFRTEVMGHLDQVVGLVLVNGRHLPESRWDTVLHGGDAVAIVPPMGGG